MTIVATIAAAILALNLCLNIAYVDKTGSISLEKYENSKEGGEWSWDYKDPTTFAIDGKCREIAATERGIQKYMYTGSNGNKLYIN